VAIKVFDYSTPPTTHAFKFSFGLNRCDTDTKNVKPAKKYVSAVPVLSQGGIKGEGERVHFRPLRERGVRKFYRGQGPLAKGSKVPPLLLYPLG
jgi:hypothetical protein